MASADGGGSRSERGILLFERRGEHVGDDGQRGHPERRERGDGEPQRPTPPPHQQAKPCQQPKSEREHKRGDEVPGEFGELKSLRSPSASAGGP